jgi:ribose/xylose/arabinose/galactoside ABC-type transport system permease subunit
MIARIWRNREVAVLLLVVISCVIMATSSPYFLRRPNVRVITDMISADMLVTIGITLVLLTGGIDVSVGSVLGLSGLIAAEVMSGGGSIGLAIALGVIAGGVMGAINGFFIAAVRVNPLITTLATMQAFRGIAYARTRGYMIGHLPKAFSFFGTGKIGPLGVPIVIGIIFAAVFYVLLNYTSFFQQLYFIGGNERAARMSGVRVPRVKFIVYTISGLLAGAAGIIVLSRTMVGSAQMGIGAEFRAIPAAVIGGASLMGGQGNIIGPMLGVLLLAIINDGLVLNGVSSYYQALAQGVILLIAVAIDALLHRQSR